MKFGKKLAFRFSSEHNKHLDHVIATKIMIKLKFNKNYLSLKCKFVAQRAAGAEFPHPSKPSLARCLFKINLKKNIQITFPMAAQCSDYPVDRPPGRLLVHSFGDTVFSLGRVSYIFHLLRKQRHGVMKVGRF